MWLRAAPSAPGVPGLTSPPPARPAEPPVRPAGIGALTNGSRGHGRVRAGSVRKREVSQASLVHAVDPSRCQRHEHKATKPALRRALDESRQHEPERTGDECAPSGRRSATDLCLRIQRLKSLRIRRNRRQMSLSDAVVGATAASLAATGPARGGVRSDPVAEIACNNRMTSAPVSKALTSPSMPFAGPPAALVRQPRCRSVCSC